MAPIRLPTLQEQYESLDRVLASVRYQPELPPGTQFEHGMPVVPNDEFDGDD